MGDQYRSKNRYSGLAASNSPQDGAGDRRSPDFAAQMARAEFGRHYVDPGRIEQTLKYGEIVFQDRKPAQRGRSD